MNSINAIIFDWSGTLVDDLPPVVAATNAVLAAHGLAPMSRETFVREFELPFQNFYDRVLPGVALEGLEPLFHQAFEACGEPVTALPHAEAFLRFCRSTGRRCFILSAALERHLLVPMEALGFRDTFEAIYAGVRDKKQQIHALLATHGLDPARTAFIGDMTHDIETAQHGGVMAIAVLTGYQDAARLAACAPDVLVQDLHALQRLMECHGSVA
jgi:phosphoglycolate phosphatase